MPENVFHNVCIYHTIKSEFLMPVELMAIKLQIKYENKWKHFVQQDVLYYLSDRLKIDHII